MTMTKMMGIRKNDISPPDDDDDTEVEEILVLYGSQTGNSEAAAHEICSLLPTKLSSLAAPTAARRISFTSRVMHLDDFLEVEKARWTRIVIIVTSSYGVGQAPIGARKFRDVCDEILNRYNDVASNEKAKGGGNVGKQRSTISEESHPFFLEGVHFALLGLGDSHYTTFFKNPTTIQRALTTVGATLVGEIGKADASGTGNMEQSKVIERWIENIWEELSNCASNGVTKCDHLKNARDRTWELCLDLFPEWKEKRSDVLNFASIIGVLCIPLFVVVVAILFTRFHAG